MGEESNLEYRVRQLEEDSRRNQETHRDFFGRFEELRAAGTRTDVQYQNIIATVGEIKRGLDELRAKPARRWEALAAAFISAAAGVAAGLIFGGGA